MGKRSTLACLALAAACASCHKGKLAELAGDPPSAAVAARASAPQGTVPTNAPPSRAPHPRILLTPERLAAIASMAGGGHPSWARVRAVCDDAAGKSISSGYQAEDWGHAAIDLALCGRVLQRAEYTKAAIKYLLALVDDHDDVGDGKGGDEAARQDDGYAIRNRGFLAAIAYDWLHDDLTAEQRAHVLGRFYAYVTWYKKDGYRRDEPWSNHFMGYFGAAGMAGIACDGDDPHGSEMRALAREIWNKTIVPGYKARLSGGDYPEGWQYARLVGATLGLWIDAEGRAVPGGAAKLLDELPWLRESVAFQAHALLPDDKHTWDSADWSKKPAMPFAPQLYGAAIALGPGDALARQATFLARACSRPDEPGWEWLRAVGDDPARAAEDPKKGPTSYLASGTGVVFARTDWSASATWVALNSGPFFGDHQHLDQGHFEIARGGDQLLIDPGDYDSYSTTSHNAILVDDKKENLRWCPNQQIYSKDARIARFEDDGGVAYALAEYADAYNPDEYPRYKKTRSVSRAERELVMSRAPVAGMGAGAARVVVYDRITVTKPSYGVTWAGHAGVRPEQSGSALRIAVGKSAATVTTLVPAGAAAALLKEPTIKTDDIFMKNDPAEGISSTRFEVRSPTGSNERRFLHAIVVGAAAERAPTPVKIDGDGCEGALVDREAYVFTSAAPQALAAAIAYTAPATAERQIVLGLAPNGKYAANATSAGGACRVALVPGGALQASSAGVLKLAMRAGCVVAAQRDGH